MKITFAVTAFASILAACGQDHPATESVTATGLDSAAHSGLLLEHMNRDVRPGNDFHAYVNGAWLDATEVPADKPSYGIGTILRMLGR